MNTKGLTPRTNSEVTTVRMSGGFGQPDGFGSVLTASIRTDGALSLTLHFKDGQGSEERVWSVMLTNEQRHELGRMIDSYRPMLWAYDEGEP